MTTTTDVKLKDEREHIAWSPRALRINGWRYSGTLDTDLVTRAICAGFVKQPQACKDLVEPIDPFQNRGPTPAPPPGGVGVGSLAIALVLVAVLTLAALILYKRSLTRHIHG